MRLQWGTGPSRLMCRVVCSVHLVLYMDGGPQLFRASSLTPTNKASDAEAGWQ